MNDIFLVPMKMRNQLSWSLVFAVFVHYAVLLCKVRFEFGEPFSIMCYCLWAYWVFFQVVMYLYYKFKLYLY